MGKTDRKEISKAFRKAIFAPTNSQEALQGRGGREPQRLKLTRRSRCSTMWGDPRERCYLKATEFIEGHDRLTVTFAELALEGVEVPYATDSLERLMGEVSKRCKHK